MNSMQAAGLRSSKKVVVATLLLLFSGAPALAQNATGTAGDWSYGMDEGVAGASTTNGEHQRLGIVCTENCIGFIEMDRPCAEDSVIEGVLRSEAGEESTLFTCRHVEGRYVLALRPTEALIDATVQSREISFTVPIEPASPSVFRFSLNGAYDAIYLTLAGAVANSAPDTSARIVGERSPHDGI